MERDEVYEQEEAKGESIKKSNQEIKNTKKQTEVKDTSEQRQ